MKLDDCVFHYTDANAILNIVSNRKIWATHVGYLNDKREGEVARKYIDYFISEKYALKKISLSDPIKAAVKYFLGSRRHAYICSFTNRYDNLTMYRTYGPQEGGYCIGFGKDYLAKIPNTSVFSVNYDRASHIAEVRVFLENLIYDLEKNLVTGDSPQEAANKVKREKQHVSIFADISVQQKSPEFHTEEEVRIVSRGWDDRKLRTSSKGNVLIPYLEVDLPNMETDVLITLGPNSNLDLAHQGMQDLGHIASKNGTKWNINFGVWDLSGYRNL